MARKSVNAALRSGHIFIKLSAIHAGWSFTLYAQKAIVTASVLGLSGDRHGNQERRYRWYVLCRRMIRMKVNELASEDELCSLKTYWTRNETGRKGRPIFEVHLVCTTFYTEPFGRGFWHNETSWILEILFDPLNCGPLTGRSMCAGIRLYRWKMILKCTALSGLCCSKSPAHDKEEKASLTACISAVDRRELGKGCHCPGWGPPRRAWWGASLHRLMESKTSKTEISFEKISLWDRRN